MHLLRDSCLVLLETSRRRCVEYPEACVVRLGLLLCLGRIYTYLVSLDTLLRGLRG